MVVQQKIKDIIYQNIVNNEENDDLTVYAFTNENINGYLEQLDLDYSFKTLAIGSSGDHFFNLLLNNIKKIDLIDINPLSSLYIEIRKAMIKIGDLEDYKLLLKYSFKYIGCELEIEEKIWNLIINYIDNKYKLVVKEIFNYYYCLQNVYHKKVTLLQVLTKDYYYDWEELLFYNKYIRSEKDFWNLKEKLDKIEINYRLGNIFNILEKNKYDLVLVSNALEYTINHSMDDVYKRFKNLRNSITYKGIILASYIYNFKDVINEYSNYPICGTDVSYREILREELIWVDNYNRNKDAVLVLRK